MIEDLTERATDAMLQWRGRQALPTRLGSFDLRSLSRDVRMRSIFSARTANAAYLAEVGDVIDYILSGKIDQATGRMRLFKKLKQLGYDPATGFPEDMGKVAPAERDSMQDLSSAQRLDLLIETNVRMAQGYGQMVSGMEPYAMYAYPAWELVRTHPRQVPRGSAQSRSDGWSLRWVEAGESVDWEGAIDTPMIARKDSPIWQALGEGAGGHEDALGNPFPPFAFGSGMGWRAVSGDRCERLGLADGPATQPPDAVSLAPDVDEVQQIVDRIPDDLREELIREMKELNFEVAPSLTDEDIARRSEAGVTRMNAMWEQLGGEVKTQ